jgi:hypothetical protein
MTDGWRYRERLAFLVVVGWRKRRLPTSPSPIQKKHCHSERNEESAYINRKQIMKN